MRIALVGPTHPYKGGIAQHTTILAHRLSAAGHTMDLVSWSAQYPAFLYPGQQRVPGNRPEIEPWAGTSYPLSWRRPDSWVRTGRRLRRGGYDLVVVVVTTPVQAPAYVSMLSALRAGKRSPRPWILALCHNVVPHEPRLGDRRLTQALFARCDGILVHSDIQSEAARGLSDRPITTVALPPLLSGDGDVSGPAPVRRRLLFFGLVRPYKGLDVLLRALAEVPGVQLTVAGEFWGGPAETDALIAELGIGDRVRLRPGYVDAADVPGLFAAADALVLPYRSATSSANVFLAFEHGVPVVATEVGDMPDQVHDGVDGLLCPPDDAEALAAELRRLYGEPGLLERLRAGVPRLDGDKLWAAYVEQLLSR